MPRKKPHKMLTWKKCFFITFVPELLNISLQAPVAIFLFCKLCCRHCKPCGNNLEIFCVRLANSIAEFKRKPQSPKSVLTFSKGICLLIDIIDNFLNSITNKSFISFQTFISKVNKAINPSCYIVQIPKALLNLPRKQHYSIWLAPSSSSLHQSL